MTRRLWRGDRVSSLLKVLFCTENGRLKRESVHWREPISLIVRERRVCGSGPCFSWYDIICSVIVGFKNMVNVGCRAIRCEYLDNYSIALLQALWNLSSCIILQIAGYNNHIHKDFRLQFIRPISCKKCLCRGWCEMWCALMWTKYEGTVCIRRQQCGKTQHVLTVCEMFCGKEDNSLG